MVSLGRVHDSEKAVFAIKEAKEAGFNSYNIDLMHGITGQSPEDSLEDLKQAIEFDPPHIS